MNTEEMRRPLDLKFAEESFTLRPFTIDQIIALEELFTRNGETTDAEAKRPSSLHQSREALRIALSEDYPAVDVKKVRLVALDLARALMQILAHAGFTETAPGEAAAAA